MNRVGLALRAIEILYDTVEDRVAVFLLVRHRALCPEGSIHSVILYSGKRDARKLTYTLVDGLVPQDRAVTSFKTHARVNEMACKQRMQFCWESVAANIHIPALVIPRELDRLDLTVQPVAAVTDTVQSEIVVSTEDEYINIT